MTLMQLVARLHLAGITARGVEARTGVTALTVRRWFENPTGVRAEKATIALVARKLGLKEPCI